MRVLVLGSGAREHALAWKLAGSPDVSAVFAGPGNAGTAEVCTNLPDVAPMKFDTVLSAARRVSADCVFVGPEIPLAAGVIDFLERRGIPGFGPGKKAAQLESSKAFSKAFLVRNRIPTARATEFSDPSVFEAFLRREEGRRLVVKKSGLAAGQGRAGVIANRRASLFRKRRALGRQRAPGGVPGGLGTVRVRRQ